MQGLVVATIALFTLTGTFVAEPKRPDYLLFTFQQIAAPLHVFLASGNPSDLHVTLFFLGSLRPGWHLVRPASLVFSSFLCQCLAWAGWGEVVAFSQGGAGRGGGALLPGSVEGVCKHCGGGWAAKEQDRGPGPDLPEGWVGPRPCYSHRMETNLGAWELRDLCFKPAPCMRPNIRNPVPGSWAN